MILFVFFYWPLICIVVEPIEATFGTVGAYGFLARESVGVMESWAVMPAW